MKESRFERSGPSDDVHHVDTDRGVVYLKLTLVEDLLIISFKETDE